MPVAPRPQSDRDPGADPDADADGWNAGADEWAGRVHRVFAALGVAPDRAVGTELRRAREEAGLAQRQAAAILPLDQSKISRTESGLRRLGLLEAAEVSLLLGIPLADLLPEPVRALLDEVGGPAPAAAPEASHDDPLPGA